MPERLALSSEEHFGNAARGNDALSRIPAHVPENAQSGDKLGCVVTKKGHPPLRRRIPDLEDRKVPGHCAAAQECTQIID